MISLSSSELITGENAILQVTVKTEFLRLRLITEYTFISCRGNPTFILQKCRAMQKSFVLKYSFLSFIFACLKMRVMLNYLISWNLEVICFLSYERVKYGSLKSLKGYCRAFAETFFFK